ncbi:MAG: hypothetical protein KIS78_21785 [Labilithrix sp.]|nr:hypothetical protein [Labilithrix sp.]
MRAGVVFALALTPAVTGCSSVFDDAACTLDARSYPIEVARDVAFAFDDAAKLTVEACATREGQTPTCTSAAATPSGERFSLGGSLEAVEGSLTRTDDGGTRLLLTVHVGEGAPGSTTAVRVRVLDDAEREVLKAEGSVRWSDEDCHPTPSTSKI